MAFIGTPLESIDDEHVMEAVNGALLVATLIDDTRAIRLMIEGYFKGRRKKN